MNKAVLLVAVFMFIAGVAMAGTGGGDRTFKPQGAKPVFFSHERHVNLSGKKCSACHYHTFQMAEESYKMNMEMINKGQFCGICHNGERAFGVKDKANCDKCHK